jgi:glycosyltransferase involved in cell wall biosynthesis
METGSLQLPGADRGLGRYTSSMVAAYKNCGFEAINVPGTPWQPLTSGLGRSLADREVPYHSTSPKGLPFYKNRPWLCSIQDLIPLDLDQYSRFGLKSRLHYQNATRSDLVIANSEYTKNRWCSRYSYPEQYVAVLSLPVAEDFFQIAADDRDMNGYVCTLVDLRTRDPRKRWHWLGDIAEALGDLGVALHVAGRGLENLADIAPTAVAVSTPSDEDLRKFYSKSLAFLYTSAYEGQGLPPLEAMATGTPVIAFENTSITEMVTDHQILLKDLAPWEDQDLSGPIPHQSLADITCAVERLRTDREHWQSLSTKARSSTQERFTNKSFEAQLMTIWDSKWRK